MMIIVLQNDLDDPSNDDVEAGIMVGTHYSTSYLYL